MIRLFLCLGALVLLAGPIQAQCSSSSYGYRSYSTYRSYSYAPTVYKEVVPVITKYQAVIPLVEFPTYSAVYVPSPVYTPVPAVSAPVHSGLGTPGATPPGSTTLPSAAPAPSDLARILQLLESMDARIKALEGKKPAALPPPAPPEKTSTSAPAATPKLPVAMQVVATKCAACHVQGREKEGGDLVLINKDGSRPPLTQRQYKAYVKMVNNGKMPPQDNKYGIAKLTDAEAYALIDDSPNWALKPEA